MSTPTPNPTPERVSAAVEVIAAAASSRWDSTPNRDAYVHTEIRRAAHAAAAAVSELLARDARIRAETLRAAYAKVEELIEAYPLPISCAAGIDGEFHNWAFDQIEAGNPAVRPVGASAVPAEGSGHPRPFVECLLPVADGWCVSPVGHDGPCSSTRPLDTPEGDTTDA